MAPLALLLLGPPFAHALPKSAPFAAGAAEDGPAPPAADAARRSAAWRACSALSLLSRSSCGRTREGVSLAKNSILALLWMLIRSATAGTHAYCTLVALCAERRNTEQGRVAARAKIEGWAARLGFQLGLRHCLVVAPRAECVLSLLEVCTSERTDRGSATSGLAAPGSWRRGRRSSVGRARLASCASCGHRGRSRARASRGGRARGCRKPSSPPSRCGRERRGHLARADGHVAPAQTCASRPSEEADGAPEQLVVSVELIELLLGDCDA